MLLSRRMVTCVHPVDILRWAPPPTFPIEPLGRKCTLIFLNAACDPTILDDNEASIRRLNYVLRDLSILLASNGSLVFALGSCLVNSEYPTRKSNAVFLSMSELGADWAGRYAKSNQNVIVAECRE